MTTYYESYSSGKGKYIVESNNGHNLLFNEKNDDIVLFLTAIPIIGTLIILLYYFSRGKIVKED